MQLSLKGNSAILIDRATAVVTKANANTLDLPSQVSNINFSASGRVATGSATAVVVFEVGNRDEWIEAGRVELTITPDGDAGGFNSQRWNNCRAYIESISGTYTSLAISASVGVGV